MLGPFEVIIGVTPEMIHNWGWFLAFGVVLMSLILGSPITHLLAQSDMVVALPPEVVRTHVEHRLLFGLAEGP